MRQSLRLFLFLLSSLPALGQSEKFITICTYDVMNYSAAASELRSTALASVLQAIYPNVLVLNNVVGEEGRSKFMSDVVPKIFSGNWPLKSAPASDGPGGDNALLYDSVRTDVIAHRVIATEGSNVDRWTLVIRETSDTVEILGCHLTSGTDTASTGRRYREAIAIRSALISIPAGRHYVIAGNLNVYNSDENAYQALIQPGKFTPHADDPIDRPGAWHDNPAFAGLHSQSTRVDPIDGGSGGGLHDRFDFLLVSPSIDGHIMDGSYMAFGNDGKHFNDSVSRLPNEVVSDEMAGALAAASDHLPVLAEFFFSEAASGTQQGERDDVSISVSPLPARDRMAFRINLPGRAHIQLRVVDQLGRVLATVADEEMEQGERMVEWDASHAAAGIYFYRFICGRDRRAGRLVIAR